MNLELERALFVKGRTELPRVLVVAAECSPLSKTGGLADMAGALPRELLRLGMDARVITPYHHVIKEKYGAQVEHIGYLYVDLGWRHEYAGVEKIMLDGVTVYLIDSEYYFGDKIYRGWDAEVEQYAFFQRAVLEAIPLLEGFEPEVLHCNDWHTALIPFLVKTQYQGRPQGAMKTVLSIHNIAFQGWLPFSAAGDLLGIDSRWFGIDGIGHYDCGNFMKAGVLFSDKVNTVSPSYADEIRTPAFGEHLENALICRGSDVSGILNGIDIDDFNPATDPSVPFHFDAAHRDNKAADKAELLQELGLTTGADTPLVGMVTRMTPQKGFDLVLEGIDALMQRDVAFVLLGSGDARYEDAMRGVEQRYPGRVCAWIGYSEAMARKIYAGADFLLMPSAFEPCGLSQMIAQRYGTLPIVHAVGGLRDTVVPYDPEHSTGDGFSFDEFSSAAMLQALNSALDTYADKAAMDKLIGNAMTKDVSIAKCAVEYAKLYISVLNVDRKMLEHLPWDERYRAPFGAVKCGETVTLCVRAEQYSGEIELMADDVPYPMERDGAFFTVKLTAPDTPRLVRYCFRLSDGLYFGSNGVVEQWADAWQITVYDSAFETPAWAEGTVMYQVFPDRYAPGGNAFRTGAAYHSALGRVIEVHKRWNEPVKYLPAEGDEFYRPNDFYGGTLAGLRERLPELKRRGVGCIYLNPIFEADSNHRYNTADYTMIDPMLGTEEEFSALCAEAEGMGIRVILDGVFSHTGDDSVYFNRPGFYPGPGAYQGPESPYYSWYDFRSFPDDYRSWWGFDSLPEVNETDESWQSFIVTGKDAVMKRWLRAGAGGWRLDVADELPDEVIDKMRESVKAEKPDSLIIGEVWEDATTKVSYGCNRRYALGGGLDSVMNYPLRSALIDFALGRMNAWGLRDFLLMQKMNYPAPMYRCLMNLLGSHDTARIRTILGSGLHGEGMSRAEQAAFKLSHEQDERGRALQKLCAVLQFTLPGMPCVYYGDEEGMQGFRDPFCRAPFTQAMGRDSLRAFYTKLARTRNGIPALRTGGAAFAAFGDNVVAVLRYLENRAVLAVVNRGEDDASIAPLPEDFLGLGNADAARLPALPALEILPQDYVIAIL